MRIKPLKNDKLKKNKIIKKLNYFIYLKWSFFINVLLFSTMFLYKEENLLFFWDHLVLNNFSTYIIFLLFILNIFLIGVVFSLAKSKINFSIDFFFALSNLTFYSILIFLTNTLFSFLFFLELISCIIIYKFSVSKIWYKSKFTKLNVNFAKFNKLVPKFFLNMLFYQYWSTFFSSVLIFFAIINIFSVFNTTNWFLVDFLTKISFQLNYFGNLNFLISVFIPLFLGIFIKLGLTPMHLFKVEIYKGIPYITIFYYTTFFFLNFFLFFGLIIIFFLKNLFLIWFYLIFFIIFIGMIYVLVLLFDVNFIKAFFAYSTIINILLFLINLLFFLQIV